MNCKLLTLSVCIAMLVGCGKNFPDPSKGSKVDTSEAEKLLVEDAASEVLSGQSSIEVEIVNSHNGLPHMGSVSVDERITSEPAIVNTNKFDFKAPDIKLEVKKRILGEDKDLNGVRDDIDNRIMNLEIEESQKLALTQLLKSIQEILKADLNDKNAMLSVTQGVANSSACVIKHLPPADPNNKILVKNILDDMFDTAERKAFYSMISLKISTDEDLVAAMKTPTVECDF